MIGDEVREEYLGKKEEIEKEDGKKMKKEKEEEWEK